MTDSPEVSHRTGRSGVGGLQAPSALLDGDSVTSEGWMNAGPWFSSCETDSLRHPGPRVLTGRVVCHRPPPPHRDFLRSSIDYWCFPSCFLGRMGESEEESSLIGRLSDGRCGCLPDVEVFALLCDISCEQSQNYNRSCRCSSDPER